MVPNPSQNNSTALRAQVVNHVYQDASRNASIISVNFTNKKICWVSSQPTINIPPTITLKNRVQVTMGSHTQDFTVSLHYQPTQLQAIHSIGRTPCCHHPIATIVYNYRLIGAS